MKKILIYYNFVVTSLMILLGFLSTESVAQLASATLFYPIFVYFSLQVFPNRQKAIILPKEVTPSKKGKKLKSTKDKIETLKKIEEGEVNKKFDLDRRAFIKLIGSAGTAVFIFSVFGIKKAQAAFFGSVPGPGIVGLKDSSGNLIDPAEKHPTDGYKISELDDSVPAYYGFTNADGEWFIMREESSGAYRYWRGSSNFSANWALRDDAGTTYDYFENVF
jgi:hypothetical protein